MVGGRLPFDFYHPAQLLFQQFPCDNMFRTLSAAEKAALDGRNLGPDTQQCEEFMEEFLVRVKVALALQASYWTALPARLGKVQHSRDGTDSDSNRAALLKPRLMPHHALNQLELKYLPPHTFKPLPVRRTNLKSQHSQKSRFQLNTPLPYLPIFGTNWSCRKTIELCMNGTAPN